MCLQFQDGTTVTGPHMDLDLFERFAAEIFPHVTRFQPSVSGEPLMARGLEQQLAVAERFGVKTELVSNATLLNQRMRELILPTLGRMIISFDGATKETFEWIRHGAKFEKVVENVRALGSMVAEIPAESRPVLSFGTVLMRKNIEELSALLRLAKELGLHYVGVSHLHPVTEEMKLQSLAHCPSLAIRCIEEAGRVAEEIEMPLVVQPLDQLIATTALGAAQRRAIAAKDGVVEGLEYRSFAVNKIPGFPGIDPSSKESKGIQARRAKAQKKSRLPVRAKAKPKPKAQEVGRIQVCDYLWNKTYVALDGNVRMCCVPGTPNLGNLNNESFEEVWNNDAYRCLRESLVRCEPVAFCRGCQHVVTLEDPVEIDRWLNGQAAPEHSSFPSIPPIIDPFRKRAADEGVGPESSEEITPRLVWMPVRNAAGYVVEFSLDDFETVEWATSWDDTLVIKDPEFTIPLNIWKQAPLRKRIRWRALSQVPENDLQVELGGGELERLGDPEATP